MRRRRALADLGFNGWGSDTARGEQHRLEVVGLGADWNDPDQGFVGHLEDRLMPHRHVSLAPRVTFTTA
jgi:hypothetical protein